jgi:hypothetical protein
LGKAGGRLDPVAAVVDFPIFFFAARRLGR